MTAPGPISADRLKSFIERAERMIEERKGVQGDLRDIFVEAKSAGYNPKIMRRIIAERARDAAELAAEQDEMDTYRHALGMAVDMVRDGLSLREASRKAGVSKSSIHRALAVPALSQETADLRNTSAGDGIEALTPDGQGAVAGNPIEDAGEGEGCGPGATPAYGGCQGARIPTPPQPNDRNTGEPDLEIPPFLDQRHKARARAMG